MRSILSLKLYWKQLAFILYAWEDFFIVQEGTNSHKSTVSFLCISDQSSFVQVGMNAQYEHSLQLHLHHLVHQRPKIWITYKQMLHCVPTETEMIKNKNIILWANTFTSFMHLLHINWWIIHPLHDALILYIRQTNPNAVCNHWRYVSLCVKMSKIFCQSLTKVYKCTHTLRHNDINTVQTLNSLNIR